MGNSSQLQHISGNENECNCIYVNKNHKKSINDIFLLIRKGDGINDRYENCYEKPSE